MEFQVDERSLEDALSKIEQARNWGPRVVSKLENAVRSANDEDLFRVNPVRWAQDKHMDEHEATDLFLYAAKSGLFYMEWNVICPCCGKITQSLRDLHNAQAQMDCTVCGRRDQATLDDYVQITFTLSPAVRSLRFHHPETLSLEEYCFKYLFEPGTRFSFGDDILTLLDFLKTLTNHFALFLPGEKLTVEVEIPPDALIIGDDLFNAKTFILVVDDQPAPETQTVAIHLTQGGFTVSAPRLPVQEMRVDKKLIMGDFYSLHPGKIQLEFEQASTTKAVLLVWHATMEQIRNTPDAIFPPCLTAKRLFACQTFHSLFRAEVFQESQGFSVKDVTILFTDLKSSTQLYQRIGDLNAFALVREHYGVLNQAILHHHGAVVKTIGDAIMATFYQPMDAVRAALEMLTGLQPLNQSSHYENLILKIGVHRGAAISVTLNERIDYFGQTVNIASRVQGSAGGDEIYLTDEIYTAPGVPELLQAQNCQTEPVWVELKGIEGEVKVYKVTCAG